MKRKIFDFLAHAWEVTKYSLGYCFGQLTPLRRFLLVFIFDGLLGTAYICILISAIYNIGKRDAEKEFLKLQHIEVLKLQSQTQTKTDSINILNQQEYEYEYEQKLKLKKYAVFALMGVIFAGCIWFIFSPSASEKANREAQSGFNTDIPMPTTEGIIGDKRDAYEQEQMKQRQAERMRSLADFGSLLGETSQNQADDLVLLTDEQQPSSTTRTTSGAHSPRNVSSMQHSMNAYHDINRTLGSFYEQPRENPENERLRQELEELKMQINETENRRNTVDEQMALMEKSFQMASRYLPMGIGASETVATIETETNNKNASGKTMVVPVTQFVEQTVSALPQEMSGKDLIEAFSQPRNMGFFTPTAATATERKNTISASVYADQTVMDGENVRLRLLEPMLAGKMLIRENTILSGFARIQGERLQITISSLEYNGTIVPVELRVYDTDGQLGIFIPNTQELNAGKEIIAGMGTSAGASISLSDDAGKQLVADMGRNVIQGTSQFFSKKLREVKVNLKAGYRVFLLPNDN